MIYRIETDTYGLITREQQPETYWHEKLAGIISLVTHADEVQLADALVADYQLLPAQKEEIIRKLATGVAQYHTYPKEAEFAIYPGYLDLQHVNGQLVCWRDRDYILLKSGGQYRLWCQVSSGAAETDREIILSQAQVKQYRKEGMAYVWELVTDLKKPGSSVYKKAIQEGRKFL